ncbi:hypothetical protein HK098_007045, partial [Nowakowskiella sp. JEL0407]
MVDRPEYSLGSFLERDRPCVPYSKQFPQSSLSSGTVRDPQRNVPSSDKSTSKRPIGGEQYLFGSSGAIRNVKSSEGADIPENTNVKPLISPSTQSTIDTLFLRLLPPVEIDPNLPDKEELNKLILEKSTPVVLPAVPAPITTAPAQIDMSRTPKSSTKKSIDTIPLQTSATPIPTPKSKSTKVRTDPIQQSNPTPIAKLTTANEDDKYIVTLKLPPDVRLSKLLEEIMSYKPSAQPKQSSGPDNTPKLTRKLKAVDPKPSVEPTSQPVVKSTPKKKKLQPIEDKSATEATKPISNQTTKKRSLSPPVAVAKPSPASSKRIRPETRTEADSSSISDRIAESNDAAKKITPIPTVKIHSAESSAVTASSSKKNDGKVRIEISPLKNVSLGKGMKFGSKSLDELSGNRKEQTLKATEKINPTPVDTNASSPRKPQISITTAGLAPEKSKVEGKSPLKTTIPMLEKKTNEIVQGRIGLAKPPTDESPKTVEQQKPEEKVIRKEVVNQTPPPIPTKETVKESNLPSYRKRPARDSSVSHDGSETSKRQRSSSKSSVSTADLSEGSDLNKREAEKKLNKSEIRYARDGSKDRSSISRGPGYYRKERRRSRSSEKSRSRSRSPGRNRNRGRSRDRKDRDRRSRSRSRNRDEGRDKYNRSSRSDRDDNRKKNRDDKYKDQSRKDYDRDREDRRSQNSTPRKDRVSTTSSSVRQSTIERENDQKSATQDIKIDESPAHPPKEMKRITLSDYLIHQKESPPATTLEPTQKPTPIANSVSTTSITTATTVAESTSLESQTVEHSTSPSVTSVEGWRKIAVGHKRYGDNFNDNKKIQLANLHYFGALLNFGMGMHYNNENESLTPIQKYEKNHSQYITMKPLLEHLTKSLRGRQDELLGLLLRFQAIMLFSCLEHLLEGTTKPVDDLHIRPMESSKRKIPPEVNMEIDYRTLKHFSEYNEGMRIVKRLWTEAEMKLPFPKSKFKQEMVLSFYTNLNDCREWIGSVLDEYAEENHINFQMVTDPNL